MKDQPPSRGAGKMLRCSRFEDVRRLGRTIVVLGTEEAFWPIRWSRWSVVLRKMVAQV